MISNTNGLINWTKVECNKYSIENLTTTPVDVTIAGETNDFTHELTVEVDSSAEFEIPSDGVYKICVDGFNTTVVLNGTETPVETNSFICVYSFVDTGPSEFVFHSFSDGAQIYNESELGPPAHGASSTASPANFTNKLDSYWGAGNWELIAAGAVPTVYPWLGVDAINWGRIYRETFIFYKIASSIKVVSSIKRACLIKSASFTFLCQLSDSNMKQLQKQFRSSF